MKNRISARQLFFCFISVSASACAGGGGQALDSALSSDDESIAFMMARHKSRSSTSSLGPRRNSQSGSDIEACAVDLYDQDISLRTRSMSLEEQELCRSVCLLPPPRYASREAYHAHVAAKAEAQAKKVTVGQQLEQLTNLSLRDTLHLISTGFAARAALHGCAYALGISQGSPNLDHTVCSALIFCLTR